MSLFERINNKIKNNLIIEMNNTGSDDPWDDKDTKKDTKTENKKKPNENKKLNNKKEKIESGTYNYSKEKKIKNEIGQRRTAQDRQQQLFSRQYDAYDDGDLGNPNQSKAQTTTQKTPPKNRAPRKGVDYFFDAKKAKKEREAFQQGRKAYTDSKSGIKAGKVTDKGVIDYITKARDMSQGTNANTKANRKAAEIIAKSSGSEYKEKIRQKYETDKDLPRKRPSNAKSLEQIKKEIDSRPPDGRTTRTKVKTPSYKRIETKVTDKEIQDLIKKGRQTKPTKTKKITVGAIGKRDKAIKDIDDLIIEPKKGEAAATEKGFKKQKKFYQQQQQQQPQSGPRTTTRTRTRTNTRTPIGDKSYDDLKKELERIKKTLKNPVDKSFGDALKKNQTGFVQPKIKPITKTITPLKTITKTKPASRFGRVMKALRKNPKTAAAALAIGTGVYLYNKGKNKPKSIPPVIGGGNKIKKATTTDINFTLGGKGGYGGDAGRKSTGAK